MLDFRAVNPYPLYKTLRKDYFSVHVYKLIFERRTAAVEN
jgi:hypothetical protein